MILKGFFYSLNVELSYAAELLPGPQSIPTRATVKGEI